MLKNKNTTATQQKSKNHLKYLYLPQSLHYAPTIQPNYPT